MIKEVSRLKTLYGEMCTPEWPDDLIIRSLKQLGEWAAAEPILASYLIEPGETLWDAGAFLGTFALGLAKETRPGRVHAVEANSELEPFLTANLENLPCTTTVSICGLGRKTGWLSVADENLKNHGATAYTYQPTKPEGDTWACPCQTLAQMRRAQGDYDMIKLDLEGMELDALTGDTKYLKERAPIIWAECNESQDSLKLFSALKWLGYDVLYVAFPAFRTANFNASADLIYPMAYEAALVAAPKARLDALVSAAPQLVPGEDILCRHVETAYELRRAMFDTPRWANAEWIALSRAELIARLGRRDQKTVISNFLSE
jgi:FkbM family methyltransferase